MFHFFKWNSFIGYKKVCGIAPLKTNTNFFFMLVLQLFQSSHLVESHNLSLICRLSLSGSVQPPLIFQAAVLVSCIVAVQSWASFWVFPLVVLADESFFSGALYPPQCSCDHRKQRDYQGFEEEALVIQ